MRNETTTPTRRWGALIMVAAALFPVGVVSGCGAGAGPTPEADGPGTTTPTHQPVRLTFKAVTDELKVPRNAIALDEEHLLISDQHGTIHLLDDGELRAEPVLDLSEQVTPPTALALELGLAGVALAPDFDSSGHLYTYSTQDPEAGDPDEAARVDVLRRWTIDTAKLTADPDSVEELLRIPSRTTDHVGGDIAFDADGYLLIGAGSPTVAQEAQDPDQLVGKVLRVRPEDDGELTPAPDNPYADGGGDPRVMSMGYRNPWRAEWDDEWGMLIAEPMFSEANQHVWQLRPGDNGGYPEVSSRTKTCWQDRTVVPECRTTEAGLDVTPPVLEYDSGIGAIISGAVPLRGSAWGELDGSVLVSDWRGALLVATPSEDLPWTFREVETDLDLDGYLWELDGADGKVYAMTTDEDMGAGTVHEVTLAG